MSTVKKPELLCPAGSPDAFCAAIEGGADAIYIGGTAFNARINAKNFTSEQMRESIRLAHAYGTKVYVAANTLIFDREIDEMLFAAEDAYLAGADALIVTDLGAARLISERIPIDLHASTQLAGHNSEAAKYLKELGFSRMVCAREMSREDLTTFVKESPIEAEVFVHGALCVCHSGQCLFSSMVGQRSGNRGECAQPCRLPFKNPRGNEYPLSLKDLSLARHIPELTKMGIASFKIEGRMKSPEYVRDVARIWRRLIDEGRGADERDMAELSAIFSRGGFTDGYYTKKIDSKMLGIRSDADKESSRSLEPFEKITRKIPISMTASFALDKPMSLTVSTGEKTVSVVGAVCEAAKTAPLSEKSVVEKLSKLGNTPYIAEKIEVNIEDGIIAPLSALNALRRAATDALMEDVVRTKEDIKTSSGKADKPISKKVHTKSAYFAFPERVTDKAREFFDIIYTPIEKYNGETNGVALPPVIFDSERGEIAELLGRAKSLGAKHILLGNVGHLDLVDTDGFEIHGNLQFNILNSESAAVLGDRLSDMILSPELSLPQHRDIHRAAPNSRAVIYGRVPLMITEKCVGRELGSCEVCESGRTTLTDRRGIKFPVLKSFKHRSLIVNSLPIYMADRQTDLKRFDLLNGHFIFTVESSREIDNIISAYEKQLPPVTEVRRIK